MSRGMMLPTGSGVSSGCSGLAIYLSKLVLSARGRLLPSCFRLVFVGAAALVLLRRGLLRRRHAEALLHDLLEALGDLGPGLGHGLVVPVPLGAFLIAALLDLEPGAVRAGVDRHGQGHRAQDLVLRV